MKEGYRMKIFCFENNETVCITLQATPSEKMK